MSEPGETRRELVVRGAAPSLREAGSIEILEHEEHALARDSGVQGRRHPRRSSARGARRSGRTHTRLRTSGACAGVRAFRGRRRAASRTTSHDHRRVNAAEPGATDLRRSRPRAPARARRASHAAHPLRDRLAARGRQSRGLPNDDGTLEHRSASTASSPDGPERLFDGFYASSPKLRARRDVLHRLVVMVRTIGRVVLAPLALGLLLARCGDSADDGGSSDDDGGEAGAAMAALRAMPARCKAAAQVRRAEARKRVEATVQTAALALLAEPTAKREPATQAALEERRAPRLGEGVAHPAEAWLERSGEAAAHPAGQAAEAWLERPACASRALTIATSATFTAVAPTAQPPRSLTRASLRSSAVRALQPVRPTYARPECLHRRRPSSTCKMTDPAPWTPACLVPGNVCDRISAVR